MHTPPPLRSLSRQTNEQLPYTGDQPVTRDSASGNLLGNVRAEADRTMLKQAFVETDQYAMLAASHDLNYVVGRRGTGKSAIFQRLSEHLRSKADVLLVTERTDEARTASFRHYVANLMPPSEQPNKSEELYRLTRMVCKIAWKICMLSTAAEQIQEHYRSSRHKEANHFLSEYTSRHSVTMSSKGASRCEDIVAETVRLTGTTAPELLPRKMADLFETSDLEAAVRDALRSIRKTLIILHDGLDEGWTPDAVSTALLGGLGATTAEFYDGEIDIRSMLFIRDNMFRALAYFDQDFTKNIDGHLVRLKWTTQALLKFVVNRLRVALGRTNGSDIHIWNRFASRGLTGLDGFQLCLKQTLLRPRDILLLLNKAYSQAQSEGREQIILEDVNASAAHASEDRLNDLLKEYRVVLPGLEHFVRIFARAPKRFSISTAMGWLTNAVDNVEGRTWQEGDFALIGNVQSIFFDIVRCRILGAVRSGKQKIFVSL
jgi:hypothetical protein